VQSIGPDETVVVRKGDEYRLVVFAKGTRNTRDDAKHILAMVRAAPLHEFRKRRIEAVVAALIAMNGPQGGRDTFQRCHRATAKKATHSIPHDTISVRVTAVAVLAILRNWLGTVRQCPPLTEQAAYLQNLLEFLVIEMRRADIPAGST
jgi:hypothetical protein